MQEKLQEHTMSQAHNMNTHRRENLTKVRLRNCKECRVGKTVKGAGGRGRGASRFCLELLRGEWNGQACITKATKNRTNRGDARTTTPPDAHGADIEMMCTALLPRMQSSGNPLPVSK